jgi:serine/threonine-protein kinase
MPSLVDQYIGEYRVLELIGKGGMGEVYKARHAHLGHTIAIKVLSPDLAGTPALERFYVEADIQARLKHPGVAGYLGFFEYGGRPCILMEYVDGESLAAVIARRGALPFAEAVRWSREIADAAAHFHALGIVHRDLKSSNVKIDSAGHIKILDFGIARRETGSHLTRTGAVIGTPCALAPEQIRGETVTPAVDIWQLGVLFYEMLSGELPFRSETAEGMYARILQDDAAPLGSRRPGVPAALEKIAARCLRKNPGQRYASAAELRDALLAWEQSRGGSVPPWLSWRKIAIAIGGPVLVAALLLGVRSWTAAPVVETPAAPAAPAGVVQTVTVDTADGPAQVLRDGKPAGTTPFRITAAPGTKVGMVLRRPGFKDLDVEFEITERREYTYTMQALEGH